MIGSTVGPYSITARLGAGGMGEVYRATDGKLRREVAIKVLPPAFLADRERLARFEREAQLLAQLHHPNIAAIFGLEESDGVRALVMELVDGPTLAERLEHGPVPVEECLSIGGQIAEALEEAHEKGIVHRDLKPQNVKAPTEGKVKVLDFGLAKAMDAAAGPSADVAASPALMSSPTLTAAPGTQLGVILGTAAYMAPEQARGGAVDKRADIWAFGVLLYEMLTGDRLFAEASVVDTLSAVLRKDIDLGRLPATTPPRLRELVRRCLERRPADRLRDIGEARIALAEMRAAPRELALAPAVAAPAAGGREPGRRRSPAALAALAGLALGAVLVGWFSGLFAAPQHGQRGETRIVSLVSSGANSWPAFSPDGSTVAFASERDGGSRIWLQDLRSGAESVVTETGASLPRYAPDGASLLFSHGARSTSDLYRLNLIGGTARRLVSDAYEGDWSGDGEHLAFLRAPSGASEDYRLGVVPVAGGAERILLSTPVRLVTPRWSPGGRTLAVMRVGPSTGIPDELLLVDVESTEIRGIGIVRSDGVPLRVAGLAWLGNGSLLLLASDLEAAAFRSSSGRLARLDIDSGRIETLLPLPDVWRGVDVAGDGRIVLATGAVSQNLAVEPFPPQPGAEPRWLTDGAFGDRQPVWSPDGTAVLFSSDRSGNLDLWTASTEDGSLTRITYDPGDDWDPAWSPDGARVLFSSNRSGKFQIWIAEADGSSPRQVTQDENAQNPTMTADGAWIVYNSFDPAAERRGLWRIRPDGRDPVRLVSGFPNVPDVSREGRYVAYRGETAQTETRIARVVDGSDLEFALSGISRLRWLPGPRPTLAMMLTDDWERGAARTLHGHLGLVEIGAEETLGAVRHLEPSAASRSSDTFDFSPDGTEVVFSTVRHVRSRIFLVEELLAPGG